MAENVAGPIELKITNKLKTEFSPTFLKIFNDSYKHASHHGIKGAKNTTESHFRIEIVSDKFENKSQPIRHRMIYSLLKDEIEIDGVHALQMKTKTPKEFEKVAS